MKKLFAIVIALMMVMALSVTAFAADILTDEYKGVAQNAQFTLPVPEGIENGTVVTLHVVGTADNFMVRFYLTDTNDSGRVMDVFEVPVENGAFDATAEFTVDTTGAIQGTAAPTVLMVKGPDYATPPENLVLEVVELILPPARLLLSLRLPRMKASPKLLSLRPLSPNRPNPRLLSPRPFPSPPLFPLLPPALLSRLFPLSWLSRLSLFPRSTKFKRLVCS